MKQSPTSCGLARSEPLQYSILLQLGSRLRVTNESQVVRLSVLYFGLELTNEPTSFYGFVQLNPSQRRTQNPV